MKTEHTQNKKNHLLITKILLLLLLACPEIIFAQNRLSQDGHTLDANTGTGTFGWNPSIRPDPLVPRANQYITGNVTGGARFQGPIPYSSQYEFRGALGSSDFSNFRRDSFGGPNISSSLSRPQSFLDASRGVTTVQGNRPVKTNEFFSRPDSGLASPFASQKQIYSSETNIPLPVSLFSFKSAVKPLDLQTPAFELFSAPSKNPFLYDGTQNTNQPDSTTPWRFQEKQTAPDQINPNIMDNRIDYRVKSKYSNQIEKDLAEKTQELTSDQETQIVEKYGQLLQYKEDLNPETVLDEPEFQGQQYILNKTEKLLKSIPMYSLSLDEYLDNTMRRTNNFEDAPRTDNPDEYINYKYFENYMRQGEEFINKREFIRALSAFDMAAIYVPQDARTYHAKARTLIAMGQFMNAAFNLDKALELSPRLVQIRFDIKKLFLNEQQLLDQLEELGAWQVRTRKPMLLFLKGYMLYQMDQLPQAQQVLTETLDAMPESPEVKSLLNAVNIAWEKKQATDPNSPTPPIEN